MGDGTLGEEMETFVETFAQSYKSVLRGRDVSESGTKNKEHFS